MLLGHRSEHKGDRFSFISGSRARMDESRRWRRRRRTGEREQESADTDEEFGSEAASNGDERRARSARAPIPSNCARHGKVCGESLFSLIAGFEYIAYLASFVFWPWR